MQPSSCFCYLCQVEVSEWASLFKCYIQINNKLLLLEAGQERKQEAGEYFKYNTQRNYSLKGGSKPFSREVGLQRQWWASMDVMGWDGTGF